MSDNSHPLALARAARAMTGVDLARAVRAAAERRGYRSGVDKQRVRKWEAGVTPDQENQEYIAEALGVPVETVDAEAWPNWLPDVGVLPLGPASTVPALREALRASMDRSRRTVLSAISGTALITLAGTWAATDAWLGAAEHADGKAVAAGRGGGRRRGRRRRDRAARLVPIVSDRRPVLELGHRPLNRSLHARLLATDRAPMVANRYHCGGRDAELTETRLTAGAPVAVAHPTRRTTQPTTASPPEAAHRKLSGPSWTEPRQRPAPCPATAGS